MTTQAPLLPSELGLPPAGRHAPPSRTTAPLEAGATEPILDSLPLLDHRTRSRAIGRRLAPFGHYLAFCQRRRSGSCRSTRR